MQVQKEVIIDGKLVGYNYYHEDHESTAREFDPGTSGKVVEGVGKDAPIETGEHGGTQSVAPSAMHLCDPRALLNLGAVFKEGAKIYPRDNWRKIPVEEHLNKAIIHILSYFAGDTQDDHLGHAQCRVHMALAVDLQNK
jgi:hypothetical protein